MRLSLRPDDLIEDACRYAGMDDFGDIRFREGLEVLLRACREEASLSLFGYFGTRWDIRRFLSNLLRFRHEEKRAPEILQGRIQQPIIITGLPRSGTTFLHTLLAADPANKAPRVWQVIHPYPDGANHARRDTRQRRVDRQLRMFQFLAPGFRKMHPIRAVSPQECSEINAHVFASLRFDTTYSVPSYRRWLDDVGHLDAYRFHRRFLQHLQHQEGGGRWVLEMSGPYFRSRRDPGNLSRCSIRVRSSRPASRAELSFSTDGGATASVQQAPRPIRVGAAGMRALVQGYRVDDPRRR